MQVIRQYWFIIVGLIIIAGLVWVVYYFSQMDSNKVKLSSLSTFNVKQIIAKETSLYYYNGSQIVKTNTSNNNLAQVIDNDVVFVSSSINGKKLYYVKGLGNSAKSYIFDLSNNTKREYKQFDGFFWVNNDGKFFEFNKTTANVLNNNLAIEYRNLPYSSFSSYAGIILGSTVKTNPELEGYKWDVVNKESTNQKSLEILNFGSKPWTLNNFMVYLNDKNGFTVINKQGQRVTTDESIIQAQLTNEDSETQMFAKFDGNHISVGNINLGDGKVTDKHSYKIESIIKNNSIDTNKQTQTYLFNNILYIIVDGKVIEVEL